MREPLSHISELFDDFVKDPSNSPVDFNPSSTFLHVLHNNKNQIISINDTPVQQVPKNTLVRFRCMIQDTGLGQEMFVSAYRKLDSNGDMKLHCYRYTDDPIQTELDQEMSSEYITERALVYCISPPGENKWSKDAYNVNAGSLSDGINQLEIKEPNPTTAKKFPLPDKSHTGAIVKFYNDMAESVKVGQLIEVIGIRGHDLQPHKDDASSHGFESALDSFANVPVVHAIAFNSLEAANSNPLVDDQQEEALAHVRSELIDYIASAIGGDALVAEFILLQLLSRVTVKNRGLKIGNFALNVSGFPSHQTTEADKRASLLDLTNPVSKALANVLENLTVHSVNLPLTIDSLNKNKFSPKSVGENLEAGVLQLVDGTVLLVDETVLDEGQLVDPGVRNFQALQNLIQHQTLAYEFPYSQFDFDTDINVVSLSTSKSMLPSHCTIRLESAHPFEEKKTEPSKEILDQFRKFIHSAKFGPYDISDEVSEYIQTAFVNERKAATEKGTELPSPEDLMLRMSLARLAAASFGETSLTKERYDYVVKLEDKRKERMNKTA